jgi:hypothetical protein
MDFPQKVFCGVFELPLLNAMGKDERIFFPPLSFFGQKFLTWTFPKSFLWCFLTPLVEKHTKTPLKKSQKLKKKKGTTVPALSSARYTSLSFFFSSAPLVLGRDSRPPLWLVAARGGREPTNPGRGRSYTAYLFGCWLRFDIIFNRGI